MIYFFINIVKDFRPHKVVEENRRWKKQKNKSNLKHHGTTGLEICSNTWFNKQGQVWIIWSVAKPLKAFLTDYLTRCLRAHSKKGGIFLSPYVAKKIMLPILQYYIQLLIHLQPFIPWGWRLGSYQANLLKIWPIRINNGYYLWL